MKILEINKFTFINGGADRHFIDVTDLLKSKGHEVAVFSMKHPKNRFSPWKKYFVSFVGFKKNNRVRSKIKGVFRIYSLEAKRKMRKLLNDFQPDVVHIHNIYHHLSPSILGEIKKRHIPIVMTVHDYHLISPDYLGGGKSEEWRELNFEKCWQFIKNRRFKNSYLKSALAMGEFVLNRHFRFYDCVDLFISPSVFTKERLIRAGVDAKKIVVIPHFIKGDFEMQKFCDRRRGKYVLYFGELSRQKGVDKLIKTFCDRKGVKLYLAGRAKDGFKVEKHPHIKHTGFLNSRELDDYIKNSLFVISYSRLPETFGLIALEAMKNGKPFIGFDGNAYGEIVENDKTGYLGRDYAEMEKYIDKLIGDDGLRILFSRNALERAKDFGSEDFYEKLMVIFDHLASERARLTIGQFAANIES